MTQIIATVISGVFQVIVALIRRSEEGAKKEEGRSAKRPSSRHK
ncbi:hypothetical protein [Desulfotruncus arcticus]|nr:hypothetical protein [Desulfotruncus arcticus]